MIRNHTHNNPYVVPRVVKKIYQLNVERDLTGQRDALRESPHSYDDPRKFERFPRYYKGLHPDTVGRSR